MATKHKTNRQVLSKMVKDLDEIQLAILRSLILDASKGMLDKKDQVREQMKNSIIHPDLYLGSMEEIYKQASFDA
jgi:hypothetical protein